MNHYLTRGEDGHYKIHSHATVPTLNGDGDYCAQPCFDLGKSAFEEIFPLKCHLNPGEVFEIDLQKVILKRQTKPKTKTKTKTVGETYLYWHKRSFIKVNDDVMVVRKPEDREGGWDGDCPLSADKAIGNIYKVRADYSTQGFVLEFLGGWRFPYTVLEKV